MKMILSLLIFDLSPKRLILCACLCAGIGACIALPKWKDKYNYFLLAPYLLFVPLKVFQRIELCFHDMSSLADFVPFLSVWLILCVYALVFLVTQRTRLALAVGNGILLAFFLFQYSVYLYQGLIIAPIDLKLPKLRLLIEAAGSAPLSSEALYSILYFAFFIALGSRIRIPLGKLKYGRIVLSALSAALILSFYITTMHTSYLRDRGGVIHYENMSRNQLTNGTLIDYVVFAKERQEYLDWAARPWYEKYRAVYHALGKTPDEGDESLLTNSLEAFLSHYRQGKRLFEADFQITADNEMVLRHDWICDFGQESAFGWTEGTEHRVPAAAEFLAAPIYQKYTPLSLEDLLGLMRKYPDVYLITDTKYSPHITDDFRLFVDTAKRCGCEDVLDRVIVQLYYPGMYDEVEAVYHFDNYILTLYMIGYESAAETAGFCVHHDIPVLTMPAQWWDEEKRLELEEYYIRVYVHTVNETDQAEKLFSQGISGVYTDLLDY